MNSTVENSNCEYFGIKTMSLSTKFLLKGDNYKQKYFAEMS